MTIFAHGGIPTGITDNWTFCRRQQNISGHICFFNAPEKFYADQGLVINRFVFDSWRRTFVNNLLTNTHRSCNNFFFSQSGENLSTYCDICNLDLSFASSDVITYSSQAVWSHLRPIIAQLDSHSLIIWNTELSNYLYKCLHLRRTLQFMLNPRILLLLSLCKNLLNCDLGIFW